MEKGRDSISRRSHHCQIPSRIWHCLPICPSPSFTSQTVSVITGRVTAGCLHESTDHLPAIAGQGAGV